MPDEDSLPAIVYVAYEFPPRTQTFVWSEAQAVTELRRDVLFFSCTGSPKQLRPPNVVSARDALSFRSVTYAVPTLISCIRHRQQILGLILLPPNIIRTRLRNVRALLLAFALALIIAQRFPKRQIHLHAHFFGLMSEVAIAAHLIVRNEVRLSVMGHANDVARPPSPQRLLSQAEYCDFVACASDYVGLQLRRIGYQGVSRTVHCGVQVGEAASTLVCPPRILSVGRLVPKKGFDDCLRAAARLRNGGIAYTWDIVGDGPELDELRRQRDLLDLSGTVTFMGSLHPKDVSDLLASGISLFVLPCKQAPDGDADGIPVALMEAMAYGVPVVTTHVGGIAELVTNNETGFIVEPSEPEMLATTIDNILISPDRGLSIGERGRERVRSEYNAQSEAKKLLHLIDEAWLPT